MIPNSHSDPVEAVPALYNATGGGIEQLIDPELIGVLIIGFFLLMVWTLTWKGLALWTAANNKSKGWFIALLVINTMGIMDLIYYFSARKKK
jgi:hypothetical protein